MTVKNFYGYLDSKNYNVSKMLRNLSLSGVEKKNTVLVVLRYVSAAIFPSPC
jgi:hypothetical protein